MCPSTAEPGGSRAVYEQVAVELSLRHIRIEQEIYASQLSGATARRLRALSGEPALVVVRRYSADEVGCFEVARAVHPAGRFRYRQTLINASPEF